MPDNGDVSNSVVLPFSLRFRMGSTGVAPAIQFTLDAWKNSNGTETQIMNVDDVDAPAASNSVANLATVSRVTRWGASGATLRSNDVRLDLHTKYDLMNDDNNHQAIKFLTVTICGSQTN